MKPFHQRVVDAACRLTTEGFRPFPIAPRTKRPAVRGWQEAAARTPGDVRALFEPWPECWLGVCTGAGLAVIDIDEPTFDAMELYDHLPATREVRTRRGAHLWFSVPTTTYVPSRPFVPGVDVKGTGGLVVAPPSPGKAWFALRPLAPAPDWLLGMIVREPPVPHVIRGGGGLQIENHNTPHVPPQLEHGVDCILSASCGEQAHTLYRVSSFVGAEIVGASMYPLDYARRLLIDAGLRMQNHRVHDPWTHERVAREVERGLAAGMVRADPLLAALNTRFSVIGRQRAVDLQTGAAVGPADITAWALSQGFTSRRAGYWWFKHGKSRQHV